MAFCMRSKDVLFQTKSTQNRRQSAGMLVDHISSLTFSSKPEGVKEGGGGERGRRGGRGEGGGGGGGGGGEGGGGGGGGGEGGGGGSNGERGEQRKTGCGYCWASW